MNLSRPAGAAAAVLLFLCSTLATAQPTTQPAPELRVGPVHLGLNKAQLGKVVRAPLSTRKLLGWETWFFVAEDKLRPFPLGDLWEPVYMIDFLKDSSIGRVVGRIARVRGKTIEFADTQDRVRQLLGPPAGRSDSEAMETYYYDASDRKSYLCVRFGRPGLGVSLVELHRGVRN